MRIDRRVVLAPESQADPWLTYRTVMDFIRGLDDGNVRLRPEEEVLPAIQNGRFFSLREAATGALVGISAQYSGGGKDAPVCEFGSTLIAPKMRGYRAQQIIYRYQIAAQWLSKDWPGLGLYAVVKEAATGSWLNIKACGFKRYRQIPPGIRAVGISSHKEIEAGSKHLYVLPLSGVAAALDFVASNRNVVRSNHSNNGTVMELTCAFHYFRELAEADVVDIRTEAAKVRELAAKERLLDEGLLDDEKE